jgi:hypothetical protein
VFRLIKREQLRIAHELLKLHRIGVIKGADSEACFCATLIHRFDATVIETTDKAQISGKCKLTNEQKVKVPLGLRGQALADYLQRDLEAVIGDEEDL